MERPNRSTRRLRRPLRSRRLVWLRRTIRTLRRTRLSDVLIALAITIAVAVPVAGLTKIAITSVDEAPAVAVSASPIAIPSSPIVIVPTSGPAPTVSGPGMCTTGICHALRPVQLRIADGSEISIQPGQTVTVVEIRTEVKTGAVLMDVVAHGVRGSAYAIDPNDAGPVFGPGSGK